MDYRPCGEEGIEERRCPYKNIYAVLSVAWASILNQPYGTQDLYTIEYHGPWLTFNFCVISVIDLCMFYNHNSGFFQFVITGWCCVASPVLCMSYLCGFLWRFLSTWMKSPEKQCCSHTAYVNLCEFQHLELLLPTKNVPHISVFQWYKQNDAAMMLKLRAS